MSVVKKAFQAVGLAQRPVNVDTKVPALQPERQSETNPEDVQLGTEDTDANPKGKRGLVRPVASSIGGV